MAWRAGFPFAMTVPKPLRDARVIASLLVVAAAECPQRCLYDAPPAAPAAGADAAWEQSRAFDACGAWREASIDRAFGAWRCPMWETSHARFNCSAGQCGSRARWKQPGKNCFWHYDGTCEYAFPSRTWACGIPRTRRSHCSEPPKRVLLVPTGSNYNVQIAILVQINESRRCIPWELNLIQVVWV